jgi:histone deacetylase complex regulatory component SIN3
LSATVTAAREAVRASRAAQPAAAAAAAAPSLSAPAPGSAMMQHAVSYVETLKASVGAAVYAAIMGSVRAYKRGELTEEDLATRVAGLLADSAAPPRVREGFTAFLSESAQPLFLACVRSACAALPPPPPPLALHASTAYRAP